MIGLIDRLRIDAGKRTLGELIQDREAAAEPFVGHQEKMRWSGT